MSGHSKWHNIKRKKEITDAKKSKEFSKMSRLITVAARTGGGDPDANPTLRLAVQKAKDARMPKENIDKAIKKGSGNLEGSSYEETVYEGFGPFGGAVMVYCLTDNKNRTVSELRNIFSRAGGTLGAAGSTSYIFAGADKTPTYFTELADDQKDKVTEFLESLDDHDDVQDIYSNYVLDPQDTDGNL